MRFVLFTPTMRPSKEELEKIVRGLAQRLEGNLTYDTLRQASIEALKHLQLPSTPAVETDRIVITGFGKDKPGVLAAVTSLLSNLKINILDVTQRILQGHFAVILIVDPANMSCDMEGLKKKLKDISKQLDVEFHAQRESLFRTMHRV